VSKRLTLAIAVLITASLALSACGGGGSGSNPSGQGPQQVTLKAEDIKWDPTTITVKANQPVVITIQNTGTLKHNFTLQDFGVNQDVDPGKTETVTFTPNKTGSFQFFCNIPGHKEAGMVGTLTVNP